MIFLSKTERTSLRDILLVFGMSKMNLRIFRIQKELLSTPISVHIKLVSKTNIPIRKSDL